MSQVSRISINLDPFLRSLNELERKNLLFAQAQALNETAFQAKTALVESLPSRFDLRSPRTAKGFRVEKAHKKQDTISASVLHLDAWMAIHEVGGDKTSNSGKAMGVPAQEVQTKGRGPTGKIRDRWWPRNLGKNAGFADPVAAGKLGGRGNRGKGLPKAFLMRSKGGQVAIVRRARRGGGSEGRSGENRFDLVDLYYLKREVHVRPRWDFVDTVYKVARDNLAKNFEHSLFKATAFRG